MSSKFNGFSQDDINKIVFTNNKKAPVNQANRPRAILRKMPEEDKSTKQKISATEKQSKPTPPPPAEPIIPTPTENSNFEEIDLPTDPSFNPIQEALFFKPLANKKQPAEDEYTLKVNADDSIDDNEGSQKYKGVSLKDFEYQRKLMEEQNREKRQMLQQAIEKHSEKTAAEAKKIQEIKYELSKLDSELAADVAILRKEIETASMEFLDVQKQYDHFESLYLKAKVELYHVSERKELLTEHLCTIISHNEERKAKKLSDLMEKVGISTNDDNQQDGQNNNGC